MTRHCFYFALLTSILPAVTAAQPERETPKPSEVVTTTTDPEQEKRMTREERIRAHHARIEGIIEQNRDKQAAFQAAAMRPWLKDDQTSMMRSGLPRVMETVAGTEVATPERLDCFRVRVAENLERPEARTVVEQLREDGFTSYSIRLNSQSPYRYDVRLQYENAAGAEKAEKRLGELGYKFNTITSGRVILRPESSTTSSTKQAD